MQPAYYYINGQFVKDDQAKIHVTDLGLVRGYGIFDFFRVQDGEALFLDAHLDRFERSARLLHLPIPESRNNLQKAIMESARLNAQPSLGIKLILTGGYSPDGYEPTTPNLIIIAKPLHIPATPPLLKLITYDHQRELAEVKSLNYLTPISLLPKIRAEQAYDILYHHNGFLLESSRSNVFIIKDDKLITPKDNILKGITRMRVLEIAKTTFEVEERAVDLKELWTADEIFITGSGKKIAPVIKIDDHVVGNGKEGKITASIISLFK